MLPWLFEWLTQYVGAFRVFQYLSLRAICSVVTAFLIVLWLGPYIIRNFSARHISQSIRNEGPHTHLSKTDTPTMGGMFLLPAIVVSTLLWSSLDNWYVWLVLALILLFGLIGFCDDYLKLSRRNSSGLTVRVKLFWQSLACLLVVGLLFLVVRELEGGTSLVVPFFKNFYPDLGVWYIPFAMLVIVGTSNSVNLTDGLDGLAILPVVLVGAALGVIAYLTGHAEFASYLYIPHIPDTGELVAFCAALGGAGLGFLWFNTYPAQIFMGDVGALALGAALGIISVITRQELLLFIMGGIFVMEAISVIVQVSSYKLTGRRVFMMAPLHHHFELKGWPEPRVIVRFWIITLLLVLAGLATLKLR